MPLHLLAAAACPAAAAAPPAAQCPSHRPTRHLPGLEAYCCHLQHSKVLNFSTWCIYCCFTHGASTVKMHSVPLHSPCSTLIALHFSANCATATHLLLLPVLPLQQPRTAASAARSLCSAQPQGGWRQPAAQHSAQQHGAAPDSQQQQQQG
jgi:hypothetical protein